VEAAKSSDDLQSTTPVLQEQQDVAGGLGNCSWIME
jgi:hypothetical protein